MIYPTIHPKGTSGDELLQRATEAVVAVWRALEAMSANVPHSCDYTPQGPNAYKEALRNHVYLMDRLLSVLNDVQGVAKYIQAVIAAQKTQGSASQLPGNSPQSSGAKEPPQTAAVAPRDGHAQQVEWGARDDDALETSVGALALIAHEMRTPLNAALGWVSHLHTHDAANEQVARVVLNIERNLQLEARLVDDLLDFGQIGLGRLRLNPTIVDMREIVMASLITLEPQAETNSVQLRFSDGGPQEAYQVRGDDLRLRQALWNLLSNAVRFTPPGGTVDVKLVVDPDWIRVVVRDSGQGMNPEFAKVAFRAFAQERRRDPTTNRQGLGLGLALVRRLVELHGGFMTADAGDQSTGAMFAAAIPRRGNAALVPGEPAHQT
jgi:signal transduction histidine kinase